MIFVDSNVPMYLLGQEHPHKSDARITLERLTSEKERLVTNVEVFQEILHRCWARKQKEAIQPTFDVLYSFIDKVFGIEEEDIRNAKGLLLSYDQLSARDALHAAQMRRLKIETIFSFDKDFECLPGINRIPNF